MRKPYKKIIGLILAIVLCFSMVPASVMAAGESPAPGIPEQSTEMPSSEAPAPTPAPTPTPEPTPEPTPPPTTETPVEAGGGKAPETGQADFGPSWPEVAEQTEAPASIKAPEIAKAVSKPFVQVVYHYYDADYAVTSSHSYYALPVVNEANMTIAANKYPGMVAISTEPSRFRILLNGDEDITAQASYDAATGMVSLPAEYAGREINVVWYCPQTDVAEVPVKVTIGVFRNGKSDITEQTLMLPSNTNSIDIPLSGVDRIVVNQNGLDLQPDEYSLNNGTLTVNAAALGGDLVVSAFPAKSSGGFTTMGATSTVNHERQHYNSVDYGYVTSYYVANGNVAYCLDPSVSGVNSGNYDVSGYMERGTGRDNIIKAAWYLYRCPGEDSSLFTGLDWEHAYGYSHVAASYIYLEVIGDDLGKAWKGIESNAAAQNAIMGIVNAVKSKPMPPAGFSVFLYNVGNQTSQSLMGWEYEPTGSLEIHKVSADPAKTDDNACYSLEGAVFGVYNGSNEKIGSITTDASGKGKLEGIAAGQTGLYILEEKPPKGYAESKTKIPFEIVAGETTTKTIKNIPQGDPVTILLKKQNAETNTNVAPGNTSLEGAQFTVKYYKGGYYTESELKGKTPARTWILKTDDDGFCMLSPLSFVSGDPFYYDSSGQRVTLPLGTVTVQETKAPTGFLLNDELFIRYSKATGKMEAVNTYNEPIVPDDPIRGGVSVQKWDYELNRPAQPQGDADLKATFDIYNRSAASVKVNGKDFAPGEIVASITMDAATGAATTANDLLIFGDYELVERPGNQPVGYLNTGKTSQTFSITKHGEIVNLKTNAGAIKNNIIRGGMYIEKFDIEFDENRPQGDGSLDVTVEIVNVGKHLVLVDGKEYQPGEVVHTMKLSKEGQGSTPANLLPYSTYEAREKIVSEGYLATGVLIRKFTIRENGQMVRLNTSDTAIKNNPIRGGVYIEKWDNEIDENRAQGAGSLDVTLEIVNIGKHPVLVGGVEYAVGDVVYNMTLSKEGRGSTPDEFYLPYSTYQVRETAVSEGYLPTGVLTRTFTIREHGEMVRLNTTDTAIKNDPIRGDLKGVKISDGDGKRLAGIPFEIRSLTTDEAHVVVTDANGQFDTSSAWNPHSQNTNRGETDRDGVWFGELRVLNDDVGALLYDKYRITELPCEVNADRELLSFDVSIYRHNVTIDLGTVTNDYTQTPEVFTMARDQETNTGNAHVSGETVILDTVYYSGLTVGREYTLKGVLMDKATGQPLYADASGQVGPKSAGDQLPVEVTKTFMALSETGSVTMEFKISSLALIGKSVVVFESLEYEGKEIAVHADIKDAGQTVTFRSPEIGTSATGITGEKELDALPEVKIVDVVSFSGLIPEQIYHLKGTLMDKETGEALLIGGEPVVAEKSFVAKKDAGTVEISFTVDGAALKGKTVVVFESLEFGGREIAVHAEIKDKGQTVTFKNPEIGTSATGITGEKEILPAKETTIIDVLSYKGLTAGKTYVAKGVLMDKATGQPLLVGGKEVTAEAKFVAKTEAGSVEVIFVFPALDLAGRELVVFENLYYNDVEIAVHADIEDEAQTVKISTPEIGTTAKAEDGSKTIPIHETAKIIDTVAYKNISPNAEYTIRGILMDKSTGKPVLVNGKEVTAEKTFVADSSGRVDVVFTVNTTGLQGKTLVVFESLEYEGEEISTHADINDEAQAITVAVPEKQTGKPQEPGGGKGAQTGRDGLPIAALIIALVAAAAGAIMIVTRKRKTRKEQ